MIRAEHRAATIVGEAHAADPGDVDIACPERHSFFKDLGAFVDQRIEAALQYLLVAYLAPFDTAFPRHIDNQLFDSRIPQRRSAALLVAIVAGPRLLTEAALLAEAVGHDRIAQLRIACRRIRFSLSPTDIEPREITHRERAHRHTELHHHAVHVMGQRTLFQQEPCFAPIARGHAIDNEAIAHATHHGDLAHALGERHDRHQRLVAAGFCPDNLNKPHDVGGAKKMRAEYVLWTAGLRRHLVDVEKGGVARDDRIRLTERIEAPKHLFLDGHLLEYGLDHNVDVTRHVEFESWRY